MPELLDPLRCQWRDCPHREGEEDFPQAQHYYWHVTWHAEEYRGEKGVQIRCLWQECNAAPFKTVSKLKDHLRTHTQVSFYLRRPRSFV